MKFIETAEKLFFANDMKCPWKMLHSSGLKKATVTLTIGNEKYETRHDRKCP